ncbi:MULTISPECIES: LysR substrate-binding domain-containing protein [Pseudacidovorax]|uniref:LysR substrate-binding domain-containing protein n=1 Tax=Pseudacidovorax TaxID=433923 RepID=UPI001B1B2612|nr:MULTISPECIES: LysR substrate-binding domain-containing protein [Pseudacidovorax]MBO9642294.1 LysR family transcriptional regulator [Pseudacidovorax sp.]
MSSALPAPPVPLNLRQIEVFHAIMIAGSLSGAARMLCVSQPAVSRVLATAESRLRMLMFERVRGRLQPTPEAQRLFSEVEGIIEGVRRFNALAADLAAGTHGELSLVCSPSYAEWLMPVAIRRFRARYPEVRIKYRPLPFDSLLPHVLLGHADLAISSMPPPSSANTSSQAIGHGFIQCAVPEKHPLAPATSVSVADLAGQTLIGYGPNTPFGRLTSDFFAAAGLTMRAHVEIRSTPEAMGLVRAGVGVALVEAFGARRPQQDGVLLKPLAPMLSHRIYLIHANATPLSAMAKEFLATLRRVLKEEGRDAALAPTLPEHPGEHLPLRTLAQQA